MLPPRVRVLRYGLRRPVEWNTAVELTHGLRITVYVLAAAAAATAGYVVRGDSSPGRVPSRSQAGSHATPFPFPIYFLAVPMRRRVSFVPPTVPARSGETLDPDEAFLVGLYRFGPEHRCELGLASSGTFELMAEGSDGREHHSAGEWRVVVDLLELTHRTVDGSRPTEPIVTLSSLRDIKAMAHLNVDSRARRSEK